MKPDLKELKDFIDSCFEDPKNFTTELAKAIYFLHYVDFECCNRRDVQHACFLINAICEMINEAAEKDKER